MPKSNPPSLVYFGSPKQARLEAKETLPAKLDLILECMKLRDRVKGHTVAIKMHTGNNIIYSTIHPVFVRKVVQAVKDGGGKPFITDLEWDTAGAEGRGYSSEVLGCPVYPAGGPDGKYHYEHIHTYKNIKRWLVNGAIQDASFLINFSHAKGHPSCSFGGAIKNLALGCMAGETRSAMHDSMQFDPYWFPEKCPDEEIRKRIKAICPYEALVDDKQHPEYLHLHPEQCNNCGRCLSIAPKGSLKIDPANWESFMEANAISVKLILSTFEPGNAVHLCLATHMAPLCDCFGFTSLPILPDAGIYGSDDIVALDQAVIDCTNSMQLIEENVPAAIEILPLEGVHPLQKIHGIHKNPYKITEYAEKYGVGSRNYQMEDVYPLEAITRAPLPYVSAR